MLALCLLGLTDGRMWLVRLFGFEHRPSREARAHTGSACSTSFLYLSDLRTVALHRACLRLASPILFLWWMRDMWVCGAHRFFLGLVDS